MSESKIQPVSMIDWVQTGDTETDWLIQDFLPAESLVMVSGPRKKAYKTWFTMLISLLVASGRNYEAFQVTEPRKVLFIEEEGTTPDTKARFIKLMNALKLKPEELGPEDPLTQNFQLLHHLRLKLDEPLWVKDLLRYVARERPALVVLDALTYMYSGDENKKQDLQAVVDVMFWLRKLGCAVLWIYHSGKVQHEDVDLDVRGSSILLDAYDVHFALRRKNYQDNHIWLTCRYRDHAEQVLKLSWHIGDAARLMLNEPSPDDDLIDILSRLENQMVPTAEYSTKQFREMSGLAPGDAAKLRNTMIKQGKLEARRGGRVVALAPKKK